MTGIFDAASCFRHCTMTAGHTVRSAEKDDTISAECLATLRGIRLKQRAHDGSSKRSKRLQWWHDASRWPLGDSNGLQPPWAVLVHVLRYRRRSGGSGCWNALIRGEAAAMRPKTCISQPTLFAENTITACLSSKMETETS